MATAATNTVVLPDSVRAELAAAAEAAGASLEDITVNVNSTISAKRATVTFAPES